MNRIPVLATIREAYGFAAANLGAIVGVIWLPMLIVSVSGFFAAQRCYAQMAEALTASAQADSAVLLILLQAFVSLLLNAVMWVAVTQLALGNPPGGQLFAFGRAEFRLARALLGLAAMTMVLFLLVGVVLAGTAPAVVGPELGAMLALYGLLLFVALRLVFFAPIAAAMEEGPVLARAWSLSQGNFWRILAVMVGVLGPVLLLLAIVMTALLGPVPLTDDALQNQRALLQRLSEILPAMQGLLFFVSPLLLGLPLGAAVAAWRAVTRKGIEIYA